MLVKQAVKPTLLRYEGKKSLGSNAYVFNFKPQKPLKWRAGQQILLEINPANKTRKLQVVPIVSAPCEEILQVATKTNPESLDSFKRLLLKLKIGDLINARGVFGNTVIKNSGKKYAFLTTGIGVGVFRAILKQLVADKQTEVTINLFFVGNKDTHYFKDEITDFKKQLKNLEVEYIYKPNRITGETLVSKLGDNLQKTIFFLSGTSAIVKNYRRILLGLHIPFRHIKTNRYALSKKHYHEQPAQTEILKN